MSRTHDKIAAAHTEALARLTDTLTAVQDAAKDYEEPKSWGEIGDMNYAEGLLAQALFALGGMSEEDAARRGF